MKTVVIASSDLICGDADGLLSVPLLDVEAASKKHVAETRQMENIKRGKNERAWVDASLTRLGCEIEG